MASIQAQFPIDISYGSTGGPSFNTSIIELNDGNEQSIEHWIRACCKYNVTFKVKSCAQLASLITFFYAHKGKALPFRFKDWTDHIATKQHLGTGDGKKLKFQLVKHYSVGSLTYTRVISKPVADTLKVYIGETHTNSFSVESNSGIITLLTPPPVGIQVFADYEFDVPVRFDTDYLECTIDGNENFGCYNIPLVEVTDTSAITS